MLRLKLRMRGFKIGYLLRSSIIEHHMLIFEFRMRRFEGLNMLPNLHQFASDASRIWRRLFSGHPFF